MKTIEISLLQKGLKDKLLALKSQKKLKNNELAAMIGRSEGTLSELLADKRSFSDKLVQTILAKLGDYQVEDNLVTSVRQYQQMWNIAESCKKNSDMRLVVGNSGIGKSVFFRKYSQEHSNVYYLKVDRNLSWNKFLLGVNEVMGIRYKKKTTNELLDNIIKKVEETSGDNPMLIIDEAEVLSNQIYKHIKNLYTATENLLGIVIVGITEVKNRIAKISGLDTESWLPVREDSNQYTTFARRLKVFRIPNIGYNAEKQHDIEVYARAKGIENKEVIEKAIKQWWNYAIAETAIKRAIAYSFNLSEITLEEFNLL